MYKWKHSEAQCQFWRSIIVIQKVAYHIYKACISFFKWSWGINKLFYFSAQFQPYICAVSEASCHCAATLLLPCSCRYICLLISCFSVLPHFSRPLDHNHRHSGEMLLWCGFWNVAVFLPLAEVYSFPCSEPILSPANGSCVNAFECWTWLFVFRKINGESS